MTSSGPTEYQMRLKDQEGNVVAMFSNWMFIEYMKKLNEPGWYEVKHLASDPRIEYYEEDGQLEFWRRIPGGEWYKDFEAFHLRSRWWTDEAGNEWFSSVGRGYEDLLTRRQIIPPDTAVSGPPSYDEYDSYDDAVTNVMRDLVRNHCGAAAGVGRAMTGVSIEADDHAGPNVEQNYRYTNLLSELQKLADYGADFAVLGTGPATFEFKAYYPWRGNDYSVGNGESNPPLTFAIELSNMAQPSVKESVIDLKNYVYVGGQGEGADRTIVERSEDTTISNSPWGRREMFRDARHLSASASLEEYGDLSLSEKQALTEFDFKALETPSCRYGVHFDLGDIVTARYRDYIFDLRISAVHVIVSRTSGETIMPTFTAKPVLLWDYWYWS